PFRKQPNCLKSSDDGHTADTTPLSGKNTWSSELSASMRICSRSLLMRRSGINCLRLEDGRGATAGCGANSGSYSYSLEALSSLGFQEEPGAVNVLVDVEASRRAERSGLNGGLVSNAKSRTTVLPSVCATAMAKLPGRRLR